MNMKYEKYVMNELPHVHLVHLFVLVHQSYAAAGSSVWRIDLIFAFTSSLYGSSL